MINFNKRNVNIIALLVTCIIYFSSYFIFEKCMAKNQENQSNIETSSNSANQGNSATNLNNVNQENNAINLTNVNQEISECIVTKGAKEAINKCLGKENKENKENKDKKQKSK